MCKSCVSQAWVLSHGTWVPGLDAPGRALWASVLQCEHGEPHACYFVSTGYPNGDIGYTFQPPPAPLLITCGPSLRVVLCQMDLERREAWVLRLHFPERVKPSV